MEDQTDRAYGAGDLVCQRQPTPRRVRVRLAPEFRTANVRRKLLLKQNNLCPLCGKVDKVLVDSGRETHVDHKWTTDEAANAVLAGTLDLICAYNKLWAQENLQVVHAACNYSARKKQRKG